MIRKLIPTVWVAAALLLLGCDDPAPQEQARAQVAAPADAPAPSNAPSNAPPSNAPAPTGAPSLVQGLPDFTRLVREVSPSVVNIYTRTIVHERPQHTPFFFYAPQDRVAESLGTGFIIDADGTTLTNNHVIAGASEIRARTSDGREYEARLVGTDPKTDIAVIQLLDAPALKPLPLGDSDQVEVGEWALAIGNALGLNSTVTKGIISARGRTDIPIGGEVRYVDFLQTDASINPGNSGGPLLNLKGEVIGINTAISREGQGIGFAIPINMAREILPQLKDAGKVTRSWLGIYVAPAQDGDNDGAPDPGALVTRVVAGGPAERAGLMPGDSIVRFDGLPVRDNNDLRWKSSLAGVGRQVLVGVRRGAKELELSLLLSRSPSD
jgi:serine protease Do